MLSGLKHLVGTGEVGEISGIVTVTDDGGSSGRLRREFGVPPPGDIRNCLVALADDEALLSRLFQYRFPLGVGLSGHSFGNLFLTALTEITGDFYQAILTAESILSVRGRILPATLEDVTLHGRGQSGRIYHGEVAVGTSGEALDELRLEPSEPAPFPAAVEALRTADLILLGPGSLYTSILPNLLIPGIRRAIHESGAPVVLLLNLMTQPRETDGMDALAHLVALERAVGQSLVDVVLVNDHRPSHNSLAAYAEHGSLLVTVDRPAIERLGVRVVGADLLADGDLIRHEPAKLARAVTGLLERIDQPRRRHTSSTSSSRPRVAVVLAAGKGTRLKSELPKVLHLAGGRPLLAWVLDAARAAGCERLVVVVGHKADEVQSALDAPDVTWVLQAEQRGTGHALAQAAPAIREPALLLVLSGDVPLVKPATLEELATAAARGWGALAVAQLETPGSLGRVIARRDDPTLLDRLVEARDASAEELAVTTVNAGLYALPAPEIFPYLDALRPDNAQGELYLTDALGAAAHDHDLVLHRLADPAEALGVNDREELAAVDRILLARGGESP